MKNALNHHEGKSPWSKFNNVKAIRLMPPSNIESEITIPGSKSFTNRALIISALAKGVSELSGFLKSDDSYWCIDSLKKLGVNIEVKNDNVIVYGINGNWPEKKQELYIGSSGTIARFLPGALTISKNGSWIINASSQMQERPIKPLIQALIEQGASIKYLKNEGFLPIEINSTGLSGGKVNISCETSSQYLSGLLICSPYAENKVHITVEGEIVQHSYVDITLDLMQKFGARVKNNDLKEIIVEPKNYIGQNIELEADVSTACYFLALAALNNGKIRINNISYKTNQPDINMLDIFENMGCSVVKTENYIELKGTTQLKGGFEVNMKEMSDQALTLGVLAIFADNPIKITGVKHIRNHESDRIQAISQSLAKTGIKVDEETDGFTVYPGEPKPVALDTYNDHRVAMSLALIGTKIPNIIINNPGCVSKTCPVFFDLLSELSVGIEIINDSRRRV